jgi:uncharacterized membrane protein YGL010W
MFFENIIRMNIKFRTSFKYRVLVLLLGLLFRYIQSIFGMRNGQDGVNYYAEVHQSKWNSYIHTIFMLGTMCGNFVWIPALLRLNDITAFILTTNVCIFYLGLYIAISPSIAMVTVLYYAPAFVYASIRYLEFHSYKRRFLWGLAVASISLIIQEIVGHYLGGDLPSRVEAIPNAILYAPFYSVSHMF